MTVKYKVSDFAKDLSISAKKVLDELNISNDKECEMHSRRKTKVSRATLIGPG